MKKIQPSKNPETPSKHPGLVPPDAADLPELPERFSWQLPHVPQHRRPTPEGRYIVVDGKGTAVATVQPSEGRVRTVIGAHRWLESGRHYRDFSIRNSALRYVAAWAWRYADQVIAELEGLRRDQSRREAPSA